VRFGNNSLWIRETSLIAFRHTWDLY